MDGNDFFLLVDFCDDGIDGGDLDDFPFGGFHFQQGVETGVFDMDDLAPYRSLQVLHGEIQEMEEIIGLGIGRKGLESVNGVAHQPEGLIDGIYTGEFEYRGSPYFRGIVEFHLFGVFCRFKNYHLPLVYTVQTKGRGGRKNYLPFIASRFCYFPKENQ